MKSHSLAGLGAFVALWAFAPASQAAFVLDTGTPTNFTNPVVLTTGQAFAVEFALSAGQTVSELSAYVTAGADQPGAEFVFSIYSNSGFLNNRNLPAALYNDFATFETNGWTSAAANWTPSSSGDYWLVVGPASSGTAPGLDLPLEASATTGTAPALGFAYQGSNKQFTTSNPSYIGVQVTALSPAPLPPSAWLMLSALSSLGALAAIGRSTRRA